jgi:superfamily I DNA/RNA helicase/mRNA-degrading endonuclease RelE of RelBE toxin-antitoxin system
MQENVKVALSDDFLEALEQLPRDQKKKTRKFIRNFRRNPRSSGINFETIEGAADPNLRSVRIDQSYRAILLKPEQGNVYVILWVDNHEDAYQWAQRRRCTVHPETGSLQVFEVNEQSEPVDDSKPEDETTDKLFDDWRDRKLKRLGVPDELLPLVRSFETLDDLDEAIETLPEEVYEALYFLAEGDSFEEVHRTFIMQDRTHEDEDVDTEDVEAALENPDSQRRFVIVEEDDELERVLDASLEKWRIFLHPMQRKIVELDVNGPIRVLGGAGTGKTVVAMHRAAWLAKNMFDREHDRILFTTYTRNLAADLRENLRKLCTDDPDALERIEVVNLDRWVYNFLKKQGYPHEIKYYGSDDELQKLWEKALTLRAKDVDLPSSFYREEWENVVQAKGIEDVRTYLRARRTGRGAPLQRSTRKKVWRVFEEYRNLMKERGFRERADALRDARQLLENEGDILPYRAIVLDEAQDMGAEAFKLIRQMIPEQKPNDLFIVGDGHQRIYQRQVVMKHCGINIVGRNRSHRLRINYRTTDEIRRFAVRLLEDVEVDDLDGDVDSQDKYKSLMHGEEPRVEVHDSFEEEVDTIVDYLEAHVDVENGTTCLVARTQKRADRYEDALQGRDIPTYQVSRETYDDRSQPGVRIATMHRVKGLEFERVIVASVNDGVVPLQSVLNDTEDEAVREDKAFRERALFYVALTRAKRDVLVTTSGEPSELLE